MWSDFCKTPRDWRAAQGFLKENQEAVSRGEVWVLGEQNHQMLLTICRNKVDGWLRQLLLSHDSRGLKLKVKMLAGLAVLVRAVRKGLSHASALASGGLLATFGVPWREEVSPYLSSSICVSFP